MAYGTTSHFSKNTEWDQIVQPGFESIVYRNNELLPLFPEEEQLGGTQYEWRVNTSGNTSAEVYSEGGAQPTPVAQSYVMASLNFIYFRAMVRITGHLRDAIRGRAVPDQFNVLMQEFALAAEDIRDLMTTTFLGTSNNGMQLAVDSAGTYANINRATTAAWGSNENALSGALTWAEIRDRIEAVRDNELGEKVDLIVAPHNQVTNMLSLPGAPGGANNSFRIALEGDSPKLNLAPSREGMKFGDASIVGVGDLTDTVIMYLTRRHWKYVVHRRFEERPDISGDDDVSQISAAGTLACMNTRVQAKSTGVTA